MAPATHDDASGIWSSIQPGAMSPPRLLHPTASWQLLPPTHTPPAAESSAMTPAASRRSPGSSPLSHPRNIGLPSKLGASTPQRGVSKSALRTELKVCADGCSCHAGDVSNRSLPASPARSAVHPPIPSPHNRSIYREMRHLVQDRHLLSPLPAPSGSVVSVLPASTPATRAVTPTFPPIQLATQSTRSSSPPPSALTSPYKKPVVVVNRNQVTTLRQKSLASTTAAAVSQPSATITSPNKLTRDRTDSHSNATRGRQKTDGAKRRPAGAASSTNTSRAPSHSPQPSRPATGQADAAAIVSATFAEAGSKRRSGKFVTSPTSTAFSTSKVRLDDLQLSATTKSEDVTTSSRTANATLGRNGKQNGAINARTSIRDLNELQAQVKAREILQEYLSSLKPGNQLLKIDKDKAVVTYTSQQLDSLLSCCVGNAIATIDALKGLEGQRRQCANVDDLAHHLRHYVHFSRGAVQLLYAYLTSPDCSLFSDNDVAASLDLTTVSELYHHAKGGLQTVSHIQLLNESGQMFTSLQHLAAAVNVISYNTSKQDEEQLKNSMVTSRRTGLSSMRRSSVASIRRRGVAQSSEPAQLIPPTSRQPSSSSGDALTIPELCSVVNDYMNIQKHAATLLSTRSTALTPNEVESIAKLVVGLDATQITATFNNLRQAQSSFPSVSSFLGALQQHLRQRQDSIKDTTQALQSSALMPRPAVRKQSVLRVVDNLTLLKEIHALDVCHRKWLHLEQLQFSGVRALSDSLQAFNTRAATDTPVTVTQLQSFVPTFGNTPVQCAALPSSLVHAYLQQPQAVQQECCLHFLRQSNSQLVEKQSSWTDDMAAKLFARCTECHELLLHLWTLHLLQYQFASLDALATFILTFDVLWDDFQATIPSNPATALKPTGKQALELLWHFTQSHPPVAGTSASPSRPASPTSNCKLQLALVDHILDRYDEECQPSQRSFQSWHELALSIRSGSYVTPPVRQSIYDMLMSASCTLFTPEINRARKISYTDVDDLIVRTRATDNLHRDLQRIEATSKQYESQSTSIEQLVEIVQQYNVNKLESMKRRAREIANTATQHRLTATNRMTPTNAGTEGAGKPSEGMFAKLQRTFTFKPLQSKPSTSPRATASVQPLPLSAHPSQSPAATPAASNRSTYDATADADELNPLLKYSQLQVHNATSAEVNALFTYYRNALTVKKDLTVKSTESLHSLKNSTRTLSTLSQAQLQLFAKHCSEWIVCTYRQSLSKTHPKLSAAEHEKLVEKEKPYLLRGYSKKDGGAAAVNRLATSALQVMDRGNSKKVTQAEWQLLFTVFAQKHLVLPPAEKHKSNCSVM